VIFNKIYELDVEKWLNMDLTKATVKINGNRRVLSAANQKWRTNLRSKWST
jgi:hypothetical protein